MSLLASNCVTWKDKHHDIVQRLAEAGAAHCQRGVEVIKQEIEERHQEPGGPGHDVPDRKQRLARAVLQVQHTCG